MSNTRLPKPTQATQHQPRLSRRKLYAAMLVASQWMAAGQLWAAPEGGEIVAGEGTIAQSGVDTLIHQATERLAIDWQSFDIAANERVEFIQPSSSSIALNRVLSNNGTQILGRIESNGQVMVVNPNGVVFGKDSIINVGGMIASGMSIDPASFINGDFTLNSLEGTEGKVINYGIINAAAGGSVTLVGQQVQNDGLISANLGAVNLAAGNEAVLTFDQSGLVGVKVTEAVLQNELGVDAAVINSGAINAEGGRVLLSASVSEDIFSNAVNNAGMNKTSSVVVHDDGSFTLGAGADVINTGDIDTSVATGAAGQVVVLGNNVTSSGSISANTGSGTAGAIELHSTDTTLVTDTGTVSAQAATTGEGGDIKILGNKVGLFDSAEVNASGANAGGQVLVGGDKTGDNKKIRNADFIYLGENTAVKTDALINGNGGKLITFASDTARIYGNLYSRGGSEGGNGGFIETSGIKGFEILNTPDITAVAGTGGTWLIDPLNLSITESNSFRQTGAGSDPSPFRPTGDTARLNVDTLRGALTNGATVYVRTTAAGGTPGQGTITLDAQLQYNNGPGNGLPDNRNASATLVLEAADDIVINRNIVRNASGAGQLSLVFTANYGNDKSGDGSVKIISGIKIETQGGDFTATGFNFDSFSRSTVDDEGNGTPDFGTIDTSSNAGGGNIIIDVSGYADIGSLIFKDSDVGSANPVAQTRVASVSIKASGDVSLNREIDFADVGSIFNKNASFTIESDGNIAINQSILDSKDGLGTLDVTLIANENNDGTKGNIAIASGRTVETRGGYFYAGVRAAADADGFLDSDINTPTLGTFTSTGATINTTGDFGGGDIVVNALDNVNLGALRFGLNYEKANEGKLERVGSVTVFSQAHVAFNGLIDFNDTGKRTSAGANGYAGNLLDAEDTEIRVSAYGNIDINAEIRDGTPDGPENSSWGGDGRDALNIFLTADSNNNGAGNINVNANVYTAGGNFTATAINFDSDGFLINTDRANSSLNNDTNAWGNGNATWSNGGNISINARNTIKLGSLTTDGSCLYPSATACTGNLSLAGIDTNTVLAGLQPSDVVITQASGSALKIAGDATFNTGTGSVTLQNTGNVFSKDLIFTSAGNVSLLDASAVNLGSSEIAGNFNLVTGGNITQTGAVKVTGTTTFNAIAALTNYDIDLSLEDNALAVNDFVGAVQATKASSVKLADINDLTLGAFTLVSGSTGTIDLTAGSSNFIRLNAGLNSTAGTLKNITLNSDAVLGADVVLNAGTGNIFFKGTTNSTDSTERNLTLTGGNISLDGAVGDNYGLGAVVINASALVELNTPDIKATSFSVVGSGLTAGFSLTNGINNWTVTGTNQGTVQKVDNTAAAISPLISFSGIRNLNGGSGDDNFVIQSAGTIGSISGGSGVNTLTGRDAANVWEIVGNNQGVIKQGATTYVGQFTDIENLVGGSASDSFSFVNSNGVITGNIAGGTGTNTILGRNAATTWTLTGANAGNVRATASGTPYIANFTNIQNLTGGNSADIFDFSTTALGSVSGLIDGGLTAANTLKSRIEGANTWSMTSNISGSVGVTAASPTQYVTGFNNIQVFTGAGSDTMSFAGIADNNVKITLGATGSTGITRFEGNDLSNSELIKTDGINVWTITGANEGSVGGISFSKFHNLTGGSAKDTFDFSTTATGSISGTITGGAATNNEIIARTNVVNTWTMSGANAGSLGVTSAAPTQYLGNFSDIQVFTGAGSDIMSFATVSTGNVEVRLGATGATGVNNFVGSTLVTSTLFGENKDTAWVISGSDSGTLDNGAITFSQFQNITGGSAADTFDFSTTTSGRISGTLAGGAGTNTLLGRNAATTWTLTDANVGNVRATGSPTAYIANFTNIQNLTGGTAADVFDFSTSVTGSLSGTIAGGVTANNRIIARTNAANTWTMTGNHTGRLGTTGSPTQYVDGFANIQLFTGAGSDTLSFATVSMGSVDLRLGATGATGINNVVGSTLVTSTLIGENKDTDWVINGTDSGSLDNGAISFSQFQNITGGSAADTFDFSTSNSGRISGTLAGGTGTNTILGRNAATTWTLTGANAGNVRATASGTPYIANFTNIQNLTGGNSADIFDFSTTALGSVSGLIDGGLTAANTLKSRIEGANTWSMTSNISGSVGVTAASPTQYVTGFNNIQVFTGAGSDTMSFAGIADNNVKITLGATGSTGITRFEGNDLSNSELIKTDGINVWTITGANEGSVGGISFSKFHNLTGGSAKDTFDFSTTATGSISGTITGGAATNNEIIARTNVVNTWTMSGANAGSLGVTSAAPTQYLGNFSDIQVFTGAGSDIMSFATVSTGNVEVRLGATGATGVNNFVGSTLVTSTLFGENKDTAWVISGSDSGTLDNGAITFSQFQNITGGSAADTFDFSTTTSGRISGTLAGGAGTNTLLGRNAATTWTLTDANVGNVRATGSPTAYIANFTNIQNLTGGTAADVFDFSTSVTGSLSGTIAGGVTANNRIIARTNAANTWTMTGNHTGRLGTTGSPTQYVDGFANIQLFTGAGSDTLSFATVSMGSVDLRLGATGATGINNVVGSTLVTSTLIGENKDTDWVINGTDSGSLDNGAISFSQFQNITGGSAADTFDFSTSNSGRISGTLSGGAGANTLLGRNAATTWTLTNANVGSLSVTDGPTYLNNFSNFQVLQGGNAVDIFDLKFAFTGTVRGGMGADIFNVDAATNILQGESGNDSFFFSSASNKGSAAQIDGGNPDEANQITGRNTINAWTVTSTNAGNVGVISGTTYITNFSNIQTLNGGVAADDFMINAAITGTIAAGDGDNTFRVNTSVGQLQGGVDKDEFIFGLNGIAESVDGGLGANTLRGRDAATRWNITGDNAGNLVAEAGNIVYLENFSNIQVLQGGSSDDTFNINASTNQIYGNGGEDLFVFNNSNAGRAELIDGGSGINHLIGRNTATTWTMSGATKGSVESAGGALYIASFSAIGQLQGGSGEDRLVGVNQDNVWNITTRDAGILHALGAPTQSVRFTNIENLIGNQASDSFIFTTSQGEISGRIDGGSSLSLDAVKDSVDLSVFIGGARVNLADTAVESSLWVTNIERITANDNNPANNVLIGASDFAYRWEITGLNTGVVERTTDPLLETSVNFVNFGDLRGGTNNDRFDIQGTVSKTIDGGGGTDFVDYSRTKENLDIVLGAGSDFGTGLTGIEGVIGNYAAGNSYTSSIRIASGTNSWLIGAAGDGLGDGVNDGTILVGNNKVTFQNFTNLIGGSGNDSFTYLSNGQWLGTIDGGNGGINTIDSSASIRDQQFHINGNHENITHLLNIGALNANAATASWLVSTSSANNWNVNSQGAGRLNNSLSFTGVSNLRGGSFQDTFIINNTSPFTGIIDGGVGAVDELNLRTLDADVKVSVGAGSTADLRVVGIENINANSNSNNTFIADELKNNDWIVSDINSGSLNGAVAFTGFANLVGGKQADNFVFANNVANLTGWIDANEGEDTLDLRATNRDFVVRLVGDNSVANSGEIKVNNIESITAAADRNNSLIAKNIDNTWTINATNSGFVVDDASGGETRFANFKNLIGGNQDDTFLFESSGSITGLIAGGLQRERDIVDVSKSSNPNIVITAAGATSGFNNIEKFIGNNTTSSITGSNQTNNWVVNNNSGTINSTIEFERFVNLIGGDGRDTFLLNNASLSGFIDGAGNDDEFNIVGSAVAGEIRGGVGDDIFNLTVVDGFAGSANLLGGAGVDRIAVTGGNENYKANHYQGVMEYVNPDNKTFTVSYSDITDIRDDVVAERLTLLGTADQDIFTLQANKYSSAPAVSIAYSGKKNLVINGSADDRIIVDGNVSIPGTLSVNNASMDSVNSGKIIAQNLELIATQAVGRESNRLRLAVGNISLRATNGDIYISEDDSLNLSEFATSNTNVFDVVLGGDLSSSTNLIYGGQFNAVSLRGSIGLNSTNTFTGNLNLGAAADIVVKNQASLNLSGVSAQNLTIEATGAVTGTGPLVVNGLTSISATSNIALANAENDFNTVSILSANNVSINDKNNITVTNASASGSLSITANGGVNIGTACVGNCVDSPGVSATNLDVNSSGTITVGKNIRMSESINLRASGITVNDTIEAKQIRLNAGVGNILLSESGKLNGAAGDLIDLSASRIEQRANVTGNGLITFTASDYIQMMNGAITESISGNVAYAGKDIALASIKALTGTVTLSAGGVISDNNGNNININANRWVADAAAGIGLGRPGDAGQDAIETDVNVLSVRNAGTQLSGGMINILNSGSLTIEQLRNNGNISIANLSGNFILDNTSNVPFDINNTDARTQGGVINAGTSGGVLTMSVPNGFVRAENKASKSNPDIIADFGFFVYPANTKFGFGETNRKIVMHIPSFYRQTARTSAVIWYLRRPLENSDLSTPIKNLVSNDQLIQIEGLSEVDPAVFTSVRNYIHEEIAILMPVDQRFDEDEYAQ